MSGGMSLFLRSDAAGEKLLGDAKKRLSGCDNVTLINSDFESADLPNSHFDYIISMWTLPNIDHPEKFIRKLKKSLKKTGVILIDTYSEKATKDRVRMYTDIGLTVKNVTKKEIIIKEGLTEKIYAKKDLESLFEKSGLDVKVIKIHRLGYLCRATKKKS
jgi:ubiquinone/menaquinone biosynthesis C-methylase UbiE